MISGGNRWPRYGERSAGARGTGIKRGLSLIAAQLDSENVPAVPRPDLTHNLTDLCVLELTRRSETGYCRVETSPGRVT